MFAGDDMGYGSYYTGCRSGSVMYVRPLGVVHRNVPGSICVTCHPGACLMR